jgi:voltage-gated potassium channel
MKKEHPKTSWSAALYNALEHPRNRFFLLTNYVFGALTIISVLAVILETVPQFSPWLNFLLIVEYTAVALFLLEYIVRLVHTKNRLAYVFSFFGIIDLLAIAPSILGLTNLTFLKAARSVRVIRMLRMLRLAKVARFEDKKKASQSVLGINFEIYIIALLMAVMTLGSLFYLFETRADASSIPHGMYWAIRAILGGVSYPQPETTGGIATLILARLTAMLLLGMTMGAVGAIMRKRLIGSAKEVE